MLELKAVFRIPNQVLELYHKHKILEPIYQVDFFVPNLLQKWYVREEILSCLNMNLHEKSGF